MSNTTPNTPKPPYDRDEDSLTGKIAIGFYEWMNPASMSHSDVPIEIKYRMYIDHLNLKELYTKLTEANRQLSQGRNKDASKASNDAYIAGAAEWAIWKLRCEQAEKHLKDLTGIYEAGLRPSKSFINKIKTFLDGSK